MIHGRGWIGGRLQGDRKRRKERGRTKYGRKKKRTAPFSPTDALCRPAVCVALSRVRVE